MSTWRGTFDTSILLGLSSYIFSQWNAGDVRDSAHVTVTVDGFIKTAGGNWLRSADYSYPVMDCDNANAECFQGAEPICIETVEVGGTPSKCVAQMTVNVAKNPRKVYAVTADSSIQGWLQNDGGGFKPQAVSWSLMVLIPDARHGHHLLPFGPEQRLGRPRPVLCLERRLQWVVGAPSRCRLASVRCYFSDSRTWPYLGYGGFGVDPGTNGDGYHAAFNVSSSGLGLLTPDPDFDHGLLANKYSYYNPDDQLLYFFGNDVDAKRISATMVRICLELVAMDGTPNACNVTPTVKRWLYASHTDGSDGGFIGVSDDSDMWNWRGTWLKWGIPSVGCIRG